MRTGRVGAMAIVSCLLLVACRTQESTSPSTVARSVAASSTTASTVPASLPLPTTPVTWSDWLQARFNEGFGWVDITRGAGTPARVVQADVPESGVAGGAAVVLDDDTAVPLPSTDLRCWSRACLLTLGGQLAVVTHDREGDVELWMLDPSTPTWKRGPDLGFERLTQWAFVTAELFDDELFIMVNNLLEGSPDHGVVVGSDLTLRPITEPPSGVPMRIDVSIGGQALVLGHAFADDSQPTPQPWAYDVVADSWKPVPNPPWISCAATETCSWVPFGDPDESVIAVTSARLIAEVTEGDLGMLDPATMTWIDISEPPFGLRGHHTIVGDDDTLISLPTLYAATPAATPTIAVLDLDTDTWATYDVDGIEIGWLWSSVTTPDSILLATRSDHVTATAPDLALDRASLQPRPVTAADADAWLDAFSGPSVDVTDLMGALGATVTPRPSTTPAPTDPVEEPLITTSP